VEIPNMKQANTVMGERILPVQRAYKNSISSTLLRKVVKYVKKANG
jgi:hypothetical protein